MSELLTHLGVNWKLLIAQAINFTVLFFVLKRFAFAPIMAMLRKRKTEIEKGFQLRDEAEAHLKRIKEIGEQELGEARAHALRVVGEGEDQAKKRKEEIAQDAAKKSEMIIADAKRIIRQEQVKAEDEIADHAEELISKGLIAVLGKLSPETRDRELIREALHELKLVK